MGIGSNNWWTVCIALVLGLVPLTIIAGGPKLIFYVGRSIGIHLKKKTDDRRRQIVGKATKEAKQYSGQRDRRDSDDWETVETHAIGTAKHGEEGCREWDGIVGFFHPFCNAGGGGERVLWAAIRATQKRWPNAKCIVYTGDHDIDQAAILSRVQNRFNIHLHPPTITFLYLTSRHWVLPSTWPRFTLLGQSLGSIILAWDAFSLLVPDIFVDTMGYAFTLGFSKTLFPDVPTAAYVHYPTISTDMLDSLDPHSATRNQGVNAGKGAGARGKLKMLYWKLFAKLYIRAGASIDVVMTNSNWTLGHITTLWGPRRSAHKKLNPVVIYPPVAVEELVREIEVSHASEKQRKPVLVYIAQFRPEKNHKLILQAFSEFMGTRTAVTSAVKLILIGSVRDDADSKRVYELRLLARELRIKDDIEFHLDVSWPEILDWLRNSSLGVNGMWNEHFGIGVVEYQAAGLISVVHDSGGPKGDIVTAIDGLPSGYHATTSTEFATAFENALSLSTEEKVAMRLRARRSARRFTEEEFAKQWIASMEDIIALQ